MTNEVSIVFCGGCNPRYDRGALASALAVMLAAMGHRVKYNTVESAAAVIYLSGCTAGCASRSCTTVPGVIVAGETIDALPVAAQDMAAVVMAKLKKLL